MTSKSHGQNISAIEVSHINAQGFWLCVEDKEYFLPYDKYPWFKDAKVKEIIDVQLLHGFHLYWPQIDVDLEIEALNDPEGYPLIYKR